MEFTTILIVVIVLVYATKNNKGKEVVNNLGDTAVHLSSAANKASAALEKQCDELLMSDAEAKAAKAMAEAKLNRAHNNTDYDDFA